MPFTIVRNDITKMQVDAIVNAANTELQMGGGVCGAIFKAAGVREMQASCESLSPIKIGEAVITPGFALPAKFVIHAAGPVYRDGRHGEEKLLRDAYTNSLYLAVKNNCEQIAFPLISSGIYGYPKADALCVAKAAIEDFIVKYDIHVYLVVWDKGSFVLSEKLLGKIDSYIDEHYVAQHHVMRRKLLEIERISLNDVTAPSVLEDILSNLNEPFGRILVQMIAKSGNNEVDVYKRANIDRRLFSKIRNSPHYVPSKPTVFAFAIALQLTLDQTEELLESAGFALSHSRKLDVIIEYFIVNGDYDINKINEVLFHYDQPLLGG